jgi:uncharacterized protein (DUF983 family)
VRFLRLLTRSLRLRCPGCGQGRLYRGLFRMHERCGNCGLRFEREPGFFLGAIYFNYGITALVVTVAYPVLTLSQTLSSRTALAVCMAFAIGFPMLLFRHARSFWLAFDQLIDPQPTNEKQDVMAP